MKKLVIRTLLVALVLVVAAGAVLWLGAAASLDRERAHTAATRALPFYRPGLTGLFQVRARGHTFRARVAGPADADDALLLLHGFPETSAMWVPLAGAAADAGYRVVAFDQRGYSPGARPERVADYAMPELVADALAVADTLGMDRFHLVGHDWGAAVGWVLVLQHPNRVKSWSALSIPHVAAFGAALANDPDQRRRSRYMALLRAPWLPEQLLAFDNFELLRSLYDAHDAEQIGEYLAVLSEPGALSAALNWYRAAGRVGINPRPGRTQVQPPVLFVWGNRDPAVGRWAVDAQRAYLPEGSVELELDAGHWLMGSHAELVVAAVLRHVSRR